MKISLSDLLIPAIILGAAGWWGYSTWSAHAENAKAEQARLEAVAREDRALEEVAHRYQATRALTAQLAGAGPVFTYQVQNALGAATGHAVLISGRLVDLEKRDGQFVLHLNDATAGSVEIRYVLECDAKVAEQVMGKRTGSDPVTAVVLVTSVEKAEVKLRGEKSGGEPSLALAGVAPFIARGRCLEIVAR